MALQLISWLCLVFIALILQPWFRLRTRRLPPGPTPLPIVGNLLQLPRKDLGREFAELSKAYGTSISAHWHLPLSFTYEIVAVRRGHPFERIGTIFHRLGIVQGGLRSHGQAFSKLLR